MRKEGKEERRKGGKKESIRPSSSARDKTKTERQRNSIEKSKTFRGVEWERRPSTHDGYSPDFHLRQKDLLSHFEFYNAKVIKVVKTQPVQSGTHSDPFSLENLQQGASRISKLGDDVNWPYFNVNN